jgi:long-subunit fatty acid transport protein
MACARVGGFVALAALSAAHSAAQTPKASPTPNFEDEFAYPQIRLSLDPGSGARALGMGGAFLARPDDATAATWNPAGLSYLRQPEISAAGLKSWQHSRADSGGVPTNDDRLRSLSPDFLAATYPIGIGEVTGAVQLSFQRVIPFGGSRDIARAQDPTRTALVSIETSGGFDVFAAGVGVQVSRKLRLGTTVNLWTNGFGVDYVRDPPPPGTRVERQTQLDLSGLNFNVGMIVTPWEDLNLGLVAKTPFASDATLERSRTDFVLVPSSDPAHPEVNAPASTNAALRNDLRLHFPGAFGVGASWRPKPTLTLAVDVTRTLWSNASIENFFEVPPAGPAQVFPRLPFPTLRGQEQTDTQQIRVGAEYVLIRSGFKWPLRIGYVNDRQYFQAVGGAPHFNELTLGTGLIVGPLLFDVAYVMERGDYVEKNDDGTPGQHWTTTSHRLFGSLIYRFPGR